jgi:hypothetical protein
MAEALAGTVSICPALSDNSVFPGQAGIAGRAINDNSGLAPQVNELSLRAGQNGHRENTTGPVRTRRVW